MNRVVVALSGFLLIAAGVFLVVLETWKNNKNPGIEIPIITEIEKTPNKGLIEEIQKGEEYLRQNSASSREKAVSIFSDLAGKDLPKDLVFRVRWNQARALEKNNERHLALEILRDLSRREGLDSSESDKLSASTGILLLKLDQETEGKAHLQDALQRSRDTKLRSKSLQALGEYAYRQGQYEQARKHFILALREDGSNTQARIGWGRSLRKLGRDWASFEVFDEYIATEREMDGVDTKIQSEYKNSVFGEGHRAYANKQYWKAIEFFQKSLNIGISADLEEKALFQIARSYEALGRTKESIEAFNKVLANQNHNLDQLALYRKGTIYFREGKFEDSANVFQNIQDNYSTNHITEKAIAWKNEALRQYQEESVGPSGFSESNSLKDESSTSYSNTEKPKDKNQIEWGSDLDF